MRAALFGGPRSITVGERPDPRDQRAHRRYGPRESPPPVQPLVRTAPIVVSLDLLLLRSGGSSDTPDRVGREVLHTYHP